jgi:sarcosine oxidase
MTGVARTFDTIVLGLGGMGSAAAFHLAARGQKVLGIERFSPAHDKGSSHGKTRVIRQAYFENPAYVPLLLRAYELWRQLERDRGERLLFETGGLMIGAPTSAVVTGSIASARLHGLPHEILDATDIARRFPVLHPPSDQIALHETRAGYLLVERCTLAHLDLAARAGAELHFNEQVLAWEQTGNRVRVRTSRGEYEAEHLVISPGPWAPQVLADLGLPLEVERQVLYWFQSSQGVEAFSPERFPIYLWEKGDGTMPYGFPAIDGSDGGIKVAFHAAPITTRCTADTVDRHVHAAEIVAMQDAIRGLIPALDGPCVNAVTCLYTNTPDQNFVLARHPACDRVFIACGFSGHGFKFASVIGEVLADLVTRGATPFDIGFLDPARFTAQDRA